MFCTLKPSELVEIVDAAGNKIDYEALCSKEASIFHPVAVYFVIGETMHSAEILGAGIMYLVLGLGGVCALCIYG